MYSLDICRRIILSFAFLTFAFITSFSCLFNILNILSTVSPNHHHSSGSGSLWTHKNAVLRSHKSSVSFCPWNTDDTLGLPQGCGKRTFGYKFFKRNYSVADNSKIWTPRCPAIENYGTSTLNIMQLLSVIIVKSIAATGK